MLNLKFSNDQYFEISQQLQKDAKNNVSTTIDNFVTIIESDPKLKNIIAFNELTLSAENTISNKRWEEADDSVVRSYIEKKYRIRNNECYVNAFNIVCYNHSYNPIINVLESSIWDGKEHINHILQDVLKCDDDDYTKEVARLIFTGGIARLYNPACKFDFMPIFRGTQGCGKSTFIRWLAIKDSWFREVSQIDGQQGIEALDGCWIGEMSELLALTKTKEVEAVKSYITRQYDTYRKPYERRLTENPRKCILLGTTNKTQFLTDKTGNRRFLPIEVHSNGYDLLNNEVAIREEILQCWLEAKHNFDINNYSLFNNIQLLDVVKTKQNEASEDDWRIGVIEHYLLGVEKTCVKDIWDNALKEEVRDCTKKDSNDIVSIMDQFQNWKKVDLIRFVNYGRQRGWKKLFDVDSDIENEDVKDKGLPY